MNFSIIKKPDYSIIAPLSMAFSITAIFITIYILILILSRKRLYTVSRLLTCNTCLSSILYCITQCVNYTYLLILTWITDDQLCRWRAYFSYMSLVAVIYSYVMQIISRFFFINLYSKYRWLVSFKAHVILISFGWIVILMLASPSILTKDVYFRPGELCWVPSDKILHSYYIIVAYYILPILLIISLSIAIIIQIYSYRKSTTIQPNKKRKDRDSQIFRNIMISFSVYFLGGIPYMIYSFTNSAFFYSLGVVSVTFFVNIEILVTVYLDREIRNIVKNHFRQTNTRVFPMTVNAEVFVR